MRDRRRVMLVLVLITVVAAGTPEEVAGTPGSYTGEFLAGLVEAAAPKARRTRSRAKTPAAA